MRAAETFPDGDSQILSTLWRELTWSHIKILIYIDDPLKREFYSEMARLERWSVRMFLGHAVNRSEPDSFLTQSLMFDVKRYIVGR